MITINASIGMKTFFPLVNIPKQQQAGDGRESGKYVTVSGQAITMAKPEYETEAAVTKAIALGAFKGSSQAAYKQAAEWQKQLAKAESKRFFVKPAKPRESKAYNHTMQF